MRRCFPLFSFQPGRFFVIMSAFALIALSLFGSPVSAQAAPVKALRQIRPADISLPDGTALNTYMQTLTASCGTPCTSYTVVGGGLPAGLTLNSSTDVLSGRLNAAGLFNFSVLATGFSNDTESYSLFVSYPLTLTVNSLSDVTATCGAVGTVCLRDSMNVIAPGGTIYFGLSGTVSLTSTLPAVSSNFTVQGNGDTIDGGKTHQLMVVNSGGNLSLESLTLANGNSAANGGAITNSGTLNILADTFAGNYATTNGGAIYSSNILNVANSTFFNNSANSGGAVNGSNTLNITASTFSGNSATSGVGNTLYVPSGSAFFGGNIVVDPAGTGCSHGGTATLVGAYNLSPGTCPGTISGATGVSISLASNGGLTQTLALSSGSDAVDVIPLSSCIFLSSGTNPLFSNNAANSHDQRGVSRPQGSECDIGAYELIPIPTATPTNTLTNTATNTPTASATSTATSTSTTVPTNTATASATFTSTTTNTAVDTSTSTPTATATNTATPTSSGGVIYTVNVTTDSASGIGSGLFGDLRYAVSQANLCPPANPCTIQFAVPTGSTITLTNGGLTLNQNMTISGPGAANLTIDGNHAVTIFTIPASQTVSITGIAIANGMNASGGGGINNAGTLTINSSVFSGNRAGSSGNGGGLFNTGTLAISNSTFSSNSAGVAYGGSGAGGALYSVGTGSAIISGTTFTGNIAGGSGGAIANGASMVISNSTITNNIGYNQVGGGIINSGTLTVSNSTLASNSALDSDFSGHFYGGGILNNGTLNLLSTIAVSNSPDDLNNSFGTGTDTSLGYNVVQKGVGFTFVGSDQVGSGINAGLSALASNGGLTQTMAITDSSPAYLKGFCGGNISISPAAPAVTTDQRGAGYPRKATCDAGAYEDQSLVYTATATASSTSTSTATMSPTSTSTATLIPSSTPTVTATATSTPLAGRIDSVGIYRGGLFYLRLHNTQGYADFTVAFNPPGTNLPVVGDWTGQGYDAIGVFDSATANFTLCTANVTVTCANAANQIKLTLGNPGDTPLAGRWQINATHSGAGVYRPSNGILYLKNNLTTGFADHGMVMGLPGDEGVAGDWTGKGFDSPGIYRPGGIAFYLSNQVTSGVVYADIFLVYGSSTDLPITGDWIAQGHDGVGMFRPTNGFVYLKNVLTSGFADNSFYYGQAGDQPVAGHWQVIYPPAPPAPVLIPKTAIPVPNKGVIVPGDNQIGG